MKQWFTLYREPSQPSTTGGEGFTLGKLYLDGKFFSESCEDEDRRLEEGGVKVQTRTAIPRGKYKLVNSFSHHFQKVLPEVLDVPGFAGVRIHGGNRAEDSQGCILVGKVRTRDGIAQCAETVQRVIRTIDEATELGVEVLLEVK